MTNRRERSHQSFAAALFHISIFKVIWLRQFLGGESPRFIVRHWFPNQQTWYPISNHLFNGWMFGDFQPLFMVMIWFIIQLISNHKKLVVWSSRNKSCRMTNSTKKSIFRGETWINHCLASAVVHLSPEKKTLLNTFPYAGCPYHGFIIIPK